MKKDVSNDFTGAQVIQELPNGKVRIYKIIDLHPGDNDDPLTTIKLDGTYRDVEQ